MFPMEILKIKLRKFEVISKESEDVIIAKHGKKIYKITKFDPKTTEGDNYAYCINRVSTCGIKTPKLLLIDRKHGYVIREHVEGERVIDIIAREDLSEDIYKQLFENAYFAKVNRITINYEPDKWVVSNGILYYFDSFFTIYNPDEDLVRKYIRLWFPTKELNAYLKKFSLRLDESRTKEEYVANKEIVLMTCKYYK